MRSTRTISFGAGSFSDIIFNLGRAFFNGVRLGADGNVYIFNIDDSYKETGREYFNAVLTVFGESVANSLLAAFGISDSDELFDMLPDMSGEVVLTFTEEGGALLSADNLTVSGGDAGMKAEFEVRHELYPELAEKSPATTLWDTSVRKWAIRIWKGRSLSCATAVRW